MLLEDVAMADVAILKITGNTPSYIKGSKARLTLGMEVLAAGYPLQGMLGSTIKITDGIVSSDSLSRGVFQHSAPTQPEQWWTISKQTRRGNRNCHLRIETVGRLQSANVNFAVPTQIIRQRLNRG